MVRRKKKDDEVEAAKQDVEAAAADGDADEPQEVTTIPVVKSKWPADMPKYKVTADWKGSIRGSVTQLAKGKIINPRHYGGPDVIEGLKKAGCSLKEVK